MFSSVRRGSCSHLITAVAIIGAFVVASPHTADAENRARGARGRVVEHIKTYTEPTHSQAALRQIARVSIVSGKAPTMRRTPIGRGAWDNRLRDGGGRELHWQSVLRTIRDVRMIERTADGTRFAVGRNGSGVLDGWGHLAADGRSAVVTRELSTGGRPDTLQRLRLEQLSPTRVGFSFQWHQVAAGGPREARGTLAFEKPVNLARLTVDALRQKRDFLADAEPQLPRAINEQTGRQVHLSTTVPWVELMHHGSDLALGRF